MSDVIPFNFRGASVRVVTDEHGNPWFAGKDVCDLLGYTNASKAMNDHCRGVTKRYPISDALGRLQEMRVLSEPDTLRLIVNSQMPAAQEFEAWVFEDVLPTIRRTGGYQAFGGSGGNASALVDLAKLALEHLPNLSDNSKQALLSAVTEKALGVRAIPLPKVEEHLMLAGEVGELLGVSANRIGKLANQNDMKTAEYGEYRLDKSKYSSRQCETFFYNSAAVQRFKELLGM